MGQISSSSCWMRERTLQHSTTVVTYLYLMSGRLDVFKRSTNSTSKTTNQSTASKQPTNQPHATDRIHQSKTREQCWFEHMSTAAGRDQSPKSTDQPTNHKQPTIHKQPITSTKKNMIYLGWADVVHFLLDAGADDSPVLTDGWTALAAACSEGHHRSAQYLLAAGADPDQADSSGRTLLHGAAEDSRWDVVKWGRFDLTGLIGICLIWLVWLDWFWVDGFDLIVLIWLLWFDWLIWLVGLTSFVIGWFYFIHLVGWSDWLVCLIFFLMFLVDWWVDWDIVLLLWCALICFALIGWLIRSGIETSILILDWLAEFGWFILFIWLVDFFVSRSLVHRRRWTTIQ